MSNEGGLVGGANELLSEFADGLDDLGAVFVYPWSSLKDIGGAGCVSNGVHVFMMHIPFSDGEFNGMGNGEGMGCVNGSKIDGCLEFEAVGKVAGFDFFYDS